MLTTDIAADGLFVVTDRPPELHHLVHLTLVLPPDSEELTIRGMIVHVVTGEQAWRKQMAAGVGVQFYGLGRRTRDRWQKFYEATALASGMTPATDAEAPPPAPPEVKPTRSVPPEPAPPKEEASRPVPPEPAPPEAIVQDPKVQIEPVRPTAVTTQPPPDTPPLVLYRVCPKDVAGVWRFRENALESGSLALVGVRPKHGSIIAVVAVVHPLTGCEFHVPARVVPTATYRRVVGVRFLGVTERTKKEFESFAKKGAPPPKMTVPGSQKREISLYESFEDAQQDPPNDEDAPVVEIMAFDSEEEEV
jgi:hypothetical protein